MTRPTITQKGIEITSAHMIPRQAFPSWLVVLGLAIIFSLHWE